MADIEGERQTPTARAAGIDSSRQDRRAAAGQRAHGRDLCGRERGANSRRFPRYGEHVGLAFQIVDDILDVEESSEALGKTAGKDEAQQKITFPGGVRPGAVAADGGGGMPGRARGAGALRRSRRAVAADRRLHRATQGLKKRLDVVLVERGLAESREKAQALIMAGEVPVDGQKAAKPGHAVGAEARIEVSERAQICQPRRVEIGGGAGQFRRVRGGPGLPGYRRFDRRIYGLPAAAWGGARARGGYGRRADRLEAAHRSARGSARADERPLSFERRNRRSG